MPSLNFMKSAPSTEALRIESEPPGAEARTSSGQSCRTPCELAIEARSEVSVTLALNGFQPQTVSVRPEAPPQGERDSEIAAGGPRLSPNPIYVELQPAPAAPPTRKPVAPKKKKPQETAAARTASTAPVTAAAPAPALAPSSQTIEPAASATNFPWPSR
jgi:PEGA domain